MGIRPLFSFFLFWGELVVQTFAKFPKELHFFFQKCLTNDFWRGKLWVTELGKRAKSIKWGQNSFCSRRKGCYRA